MKKIYIFIILFLLVIITVSGKKVLAQYQELSLQMSADELVVAPNGDINYTIKVKNTSSQDLTNVALSTQVPPNATYVEGSINGGAYINGKLWWTADKISAGQELISLFKLKATPATPPLPVDTKPFGFNFYGAGAANKQVREGVDEVAVAIVPQKSGLAKSLYINWIWTDKCQGSYGCGDGGTFAWAMSKAVNNLPSDNSSDIISSGTGIKFNTLGSTMQLPINANLELGKVYFIKVKNIAPDQNYYSGDWSSINTMMGPLRKNGDPGTLFVKENGQNWLPWSSKWSIWADDCQVAEYRNKSFVGHGIKWSDGGLDRGFGYTNSFINKPDEIGSNEQIGELFTYRNENRTISAIEIPILTFTAGRVTAHLDDLTNNTTVSSSLNISLPIELCYGKDEPWAVFNLSSPTILISGHRYRLWLESSGKHGQYIIWGNDDSYLQVNNSPLESGWQYLGFGGIDDYFIYRSPGGTWRTDNWGGWTHPEATKMGDLTFRMY